MNENTFKAYEYTTVTVSRENEALYRDCYRSFGWEVAEGHTALLANPGKVALKLKRDRRMTGRTELNILQCNCEDALAGITRLEKQKTTRALAVALLIGLIGTVFMALSVFSVVGGNVLLCVVFGIPGFIGWGAGWLAYVKLRKSSAARALPLIDEQYDTVYNTCEQASALLAA